MNFTNRVRSSDLYYFIYTQNKTGEKVGKYDGDEGKVNKKVVAKYKISIHQLANTGKY